MSDDTRIPRRGGSADASPRLRQVTTVMHLLTTRVAALALAVWLAAGTGAGSARLSESESPNVRKSNPASASDETIHGQLIWTWGDARDPGSSPPKVSVSLFTGDGAPIPLRVDDGVLERAGGYLSLKDRPVSVRGRFHDGATTSARSIAVFEADEIVAATDDSLESQASKTAAYALGDRRWVTILVRFADLADSTPAEPEYFRNLMDRDEAPSITNYLREVSSGQLTLVDNVCVGWYTLPHPRSYYVFDYEGELVLDFFSLTYDAVRLADGEIDFRLFAGVNIAVNENLNNSAWGGLYPIQADGVIGRRMSMTWLPDWAWVYQSVVAHEMGHSLGLPHSSGPYSMVYDSFWDVMSSTLGTCEPRDPRFRCVAVDPIAFHKDLLGWIPSSQRFVARPSAFASILLTPSGQPAAVGGYEIAVIPISLAAQLFYTVEVRRRHGYDSRLPGEGVIIHRVDLSDTSPARVVDATVDDNPNDEGAIWNAGERFEDAANGISIRIDEETDSGARVTIVRSGANDAGCQAIDVPETHWRGEYFSHPSGWGIPFAVEDRGTDALDVEHDGESRVIDCGVPANWFVSRWVRTLDTAEGEYLVRVESRRAIRMQIDRQILVDAQYVPNQERHFDRTVTLSRGTHVLRVESLVTSAPGESLRVTVVRNERDFRLDVESRYVQVRAEDAFDVDVQIDRFGSFKGAVTVRASGHQQAGIKLVSSNRVLANGDVARFRFKFKKNARPQNATLTFTGVDKGGNAHTAVAYVKVEG